MDRWATLPLKMPRPIPVPALRPIPAPVISPRPSRHPIAEAQRARVSTIFCGIPRFSTVFYSFLRGHNLLSSVFDPMPDSKSPIHGSGVIPENR